MTDPVAGQKRVVLTAHPLQRVGALSLCALAGVSKPEELTAEGFDSAVARMTEDAVCAAIVADTDAEDGFWLKASHSFFPNSKMNHGARSKQGNALPEVVRAWRRMPPEDAWPAASCALCGRQAVGFYGKTDVALAESISHRNSTPRGHGGLALCWACLCCFYALPYGCGLTGGSSSVMHSFQDDFLFRHVSQQVRINERHITLGHPVTKAPFNREATAVRRLRAYTGTLREGVDLMIFSNNNREQVLEVHRLDQPIAEWLRATQRGSQRAGFTALVRAHRTSKVPGNAMFARNVFYKPGRVVGACARHLVSRVESSGVIPEDITELARVCRNFAERVLKVNDEDVKQIQGLAANLAIVISGGTARGPLTGLLHAAKSALHLQAVLRTMSTKWLLAPPAGTAGPLLTTRQFRILFDPDGQSWLYRQLLPIAVLEELNNKGWRPDDAKDGVDELDSETDAHVAIDEQYVSDEDGEFA